MDALPEHIVDLIREGRRAEAMRLVREATGSDLASAREVVERIARGLETQAPGGGAGAGDAAVAPAPPAPAPPGIQPVVALVVAAILLVMSVGVAVFVLAP